MTDRNCATILVVEDNLLIRMDSSDILKDAGFRVIEAEGADDAIARPEKADHVELLFSDVDMPGSMNGLALAEVVHRRWPNIRLLLTSGEHDIADEQIPDDGRFLPEPYSAKAIVEEIRELLERPHAD